MSTVEKDICAALDAFDKAGSLVFNQAFKWPGLSDIHTACMALGDIDATAANYGAVYVAALSHLTLPSPLSWKIGAVYLAYVLFASQPCSPPVPIRVDPFTWSRVRELVGATGALTIPCDLAAVVKRMWIGGALLPSACIGPPALPGVARAARLYALGEATPAEPVGTPLVDWVHAAFGASAADVADPSGAAFEDGGAQTSGEQPGAVDTKPVVKRKRGPNASASGRFFGPRNDTVTRAARAKRELTSPSISSGLQWDSHLLADTKHTSVKAVNGSSSKAVATGSSTGLPEVAGQAIIARASDTALLKKLSGQTFGTLDQV